MVLTILILRVIIGSLMDLTPFWGDEGFRGMLEFFNVEFWVSAISTVRFYVAFLIFVLVLRLSMNIYLLLLFLKKRKNFALMFTTVVLADFVIGLGDGTLQFYLFNEWPQNSLSGASGAPFAVGVIQYMLTSRRACETFVN